MMMCVSTLPLPRRLRGGPNPLSPSILLTYLVCRRRRVQRWTLARDLTVAGASVLFSMWVTFASGYSAVCQALVLWGLTHLPFPLRGAAFPVAYSWRLRYWMSSSQCSTMAASWSGVLLDPRFPGCSRCSPRRLRALRAAALLPARPVAVLPLLPGDASPPRSGRKTFVLSLLGALILIHGISAETRQARTESPSSWSGRPVPPVAPWSSVVGTGPVA